MTQPLGVLGREGLYVPKTTPFMSSHYEALQADLDLTQYNSSLSMFSSPYNFFPPSPDADLTAIFGDPENYACNSASPARVGWTRSTCRNGSWSPPQCDESSECMELYLANPEYSVGWFEAVLKNLKLKFRAVYLGLHGVMGKLEELSQSAGKEDEGLAYYWWEPHPLHLKYPSRRFIIPEFSKECEAKSSTEPLDSGVNCDRKSRSLLKAIPASLRHSEPDLYTLWSRFSLSNSEQMEMMMLEGPVMGGTGNLTVEEAACEWLRTTKVNWTDWLSISNQNSNSNEIIENITAPTSQSSGERDSLSIGFLILIVILVAVGSGCSTGIGCWIYWRGNESISIEEKPSNVTTSALDLDNPLSKTIMTLDSIIHGKNVPKANLVQLRESLVSTSSNQAPELDQLLHKDNEYSRDGIMFLLKMKNFQQDYNSLGLVGSETGSRHGAGNLSSGNQLDIQLDIDELILADTSSTWTLNVMHDTIWDFFGNASLDREPDPASASSKPTLTMLKIGMDLSLDSVSAFQWAEGQPLVVFGMQLFGPSGFDLISSMGLDSDRLCAFLERVESGYVASNPYHNAMHAADVTHRFAALLKSSSALRLGLSEVEILAGLLAAVLHDYLHPGTNNAFQVRNTAAVALMHNDLHVLENHSLMKGLLLVSGRDTATNFLSSLPREQQAQVRDTVISMVLATDMSQHFPILVTFKTKLAPKLRDGGAERDNVMLTVEEKRIFMQMALKCADIGHVTIPTTAHLIWVKSLQEEFFRQGDYERKLGNTVSFLCDRLKKRNGPAHGENQLGFLDVICLPMYKAWVECFPSCSVLLGNLNKNRRMWEVDAMKSGHNVVEMPSVDENSTSFNKKNIQNPSASFKSQAAQRGKQLITA